MLPPAMLVLLFMPYVAMAIIGGVPATNSPASFVIVTTKNLQLCGGTIVASDVVLTSATCLYDFANNEWYGEADIDVIKGDFTDEHWREEYTSYSIAGYLVHELFEPNKFLSTADLALIELHECFDLEDPRIEILELCSASHLSSLGYFVGMGLTNMIPMTLARSLMGAIMDEYPSHYCHQAIGEFGVSIDEEEHVCYGSMTGDLAGIPTGACGGDSGGPIVSTTDRCLIGVSVLGAFSCTQNMPSVFIRAAYFADWIENSILMMSADGKCSAPCIVC